ncbi:hypothetical protein FA13DRAFT_1704258 [Coprinellus micaceus]|uniref:F-box domain-containing protein n=1 Tax=Coprinellus micaceus TaxID=71717 RepID=A0A4Y7U332_COPMI|nr:hypothetical protein FA13DRAFT_1704258 [Coprinellus micaceus]
MVGYSLMTSMTSKFHRSLGHLAETNNPSSTQDVTLIHEIVDNIEQQDIEVSKSWWEAAHLVPRLWVETTINPAVPTLGYDTGCYHRLGSKCHFSKSVVTKLLKTTPNVEMVTMVHASPWHSIKSFAVDWRHWNRDWENIPAETFSHLFPSSIRSLQLDLPWVNNIYFDSLDLGAQHITNHVQIFRMLQYCTNVETLEINTGGGFFKWDPQDPFVRTITQNGLLLPKLKTIRLLDVDTVSMKRLKFLKMPNVSLVGLWFGDDYWSPEDPNSNDNKINPELSLPFASSLQGTNESQSTLCTLYISGGVFQADMMLNALQNLSNLHLLILDNVLFATDLFANLSRRRISY